MLRGKGLTLENILDELKIICKKIYGENNIDLIKTAFNDVAALFSGKRKGFQKCDTSYHDLMHTLQVIPPFIGIIDGWNKNKSAPYITREFFDIGIIAVLLHDTGYIKTEDDIEGTGAKYTFTHIQRSADFAGLYLPQLGFDKYKISAVRNIIMCTGVKIDYTEIPFNSKEERTVGYALGTADLLGQMSANDYPEKLPILYREFEEAYLYEGIEKLRQREAIVYESVDDLIRKTPYFYEVIVLRRFKNMGSMYKYLTHHFKDSRNHYIEAIEENIRKITLASLPQ
ncbi:MAG: HD domain-containing protein [Nitrospirota bacterium]|nr:HD domain-containing protein [Nitrospirota bacterium]